MSNFLAPVEPLKSLQVHGEPYKRRPQVEEQLGRILALPPSERADEVAPILKLLFADPPDVAVELCEGGFTEGVKALALNAIRDHERWIPGEQQEDLVQMAYAAVKDPVDREVLRLHFEEDLQLWSSDPETDDVRQRLHLPGEQARQRFKRGMNDIYQALTSGVQNDCTALV